MLLTHIIGAETIADYRCVGGTQLIGHGDVYICFGIVIRHIRLLVQLKWLLLTPGWGSGRPAILGGPDHFLLCARIGNVARADLLMSSELLAGFGAR